MTNAPNQIRTPTISSIEIVVLEFVAIINAGIARKEALAKP